jgi:AcrR family transcriptional regulator
VRRVAAALGAADEQEQRNQRHDDGRGEHVDPAVREAVTVQALAARARASKGSMYHFFPDRESVFVALTDRHVEALRAVLAEAREERARTVSAGTVDEAVEAFLPPIHGYVDQHPDLHRLMSEPASLARLAAQRAALHDAVESHAAWIVRARCPALDEGRVRLAAAAMLALTSAMRAERVVAAAGGLDAARVELRRVLAAYLRSYQDGA